MAEISFNHEGEDSLIVGGPVAWQLPFVPGSTQTRTPRHASFTVLYNPVRWRADGVDPSGVSGRFLAVGQVVDWMEPLADYWALISNSRFCVDETATGDAVVEVSFFT